MNPLYERLPVAAQHWACSVAGWRRKRTRFNPAFHETLARWEALLSAPRDELLAFQAARLRHTVLHAREQVPHYRALDLPPPSEARDPEEAIAQTLATIPVLEKATLRQKPESFYADDHAEGDVLPGRTSGTTGSAVPLRYTRQAMVEEWVSVWRQRRRIGIDIADPHLTFAGHTVVPFAQARPPYWRFNRPLHQVLFSIYHLSPERMPAYIDAIHALPARYVVGYPSALHRVALALLEAGRPLPPGRLGGLFTCSESVLAFQREAIQSAFGRPLRDRYGSAEFAGSMTECEAGRLHLDSEFGIAELEVSESGPDFERGALLLTGFCNDAMPFLRYRIGDVATRLRAPCSCGREGDVFVDVDGRIEDELVTPDGRHIGRLDHVFKDQRDVVEAQVLQARPESIEVLVVAGSGYDARSERELLAAFRERIGDEIQIEIRRVDRIERESGGKLRAVKSTLRLSPKDA